MSKKYEGESHPSRFKEHITQYRNEYHGYYFSTELFMDKQAISEYRRALQTTKALYNRSRIQP